MTQELALVLTLLLPALAVPLIAVTGRHGNLRDGISLAAGLATFSVVLWLADQVQAGLRPHLTLIETLPGLGITLTLEPLGMVFALVASGLWIVASLYSIGYMRGNNEHDQTRFFAFFALSIAATMGVALSGNLLTLFLFYELLTVSTYPLVTHSETPEARKAGRTYLGILMATSIGFLLLAIIWTYAVADRLDFVPGGLLAGQLDGPAAVVLFLLFTYGIGKAAVMPVHRWLPAAMVAPTPVSALLHAVAVVKAGVFSVVKITVYILGTDHLADISGSEIVSYLAGFTIIAASIIAIRQDHLKRRLAYSTISQLSYVVLAVAILAPLSVMGAVLHIAAHAFGKITLFFAAGSIHTAAHKDYVSQLDGIGRAMPWTMGAFAVGAISMIGLPPTAGFVSKWYILQGAFQAEHYVAMAVIAASTLLNAAYFLPILHRAFLRPPPGGTALGHGEAPLPMVLAIGTTASLTVLMFLMPGPFLDLAREVAGIAP